MECYPPFINKMRMEDNIDGLVQERRNSSALAMELRLSCTNLSTCIPSSKIIC